MNTKETLSVSAFLLFWLFIYLSECKYIVASIRRKTGKTPNRSAILHAIAFIGIICLLYAYFIEPYWLKVHQIVIETPKLKTAELTIVQISDLHCDQKIRNERKLVNIINALDPDIIVFTGDAVNDLSALKTFKKTLRSLNAPLGKFAVKGNWDLWNPNQDTLFDNTGFVELNGKAVVLKKNGDSVVVAGSNAASSPDELSFLEKLPKESFTIFLYHVPGIHEQLGENSIDLFLSGHTHGGQVGLPFYGALVTLSPYGKTYESGKYRVGEKIVYVNNGIGMEGGHAPRIRFWSRPEIAVFHLRPQTNR